MVHQPRRAAIGFYITNRSRAGSDALARSDLYESNAVIDSLSTSVGIGYVCTQSCQCETAYIL